MADGVEGVRKAVRRNVKYGVDHIKYCGTGGVFSKGTVPGQTEGRKRGERDNFRKAVEAGVKMTMGTDTGVHRHEDAPKQLAFMVRYGMTPMQALQAATVNGADAVGLVGDIGTIAPGAYADIIAVQGDPLADVSVLENVGFVMKGGKVYKRP